MANWIVAAHGFGKELTAERASQKLRVTVLKTEKFQYSTTVVPPGIELVVYTPQNAIMGMRWGWRLWYQLAHGQDGGEEAAYAERHKRKTALSIIPDYRTTGDTSFPTGVFEVGKGETVKHFVIDPGDSVRLSKILGRAAMTRGVQRVYWLCCTQLDDSAQMHEI
jgi:hypothetical protein